MAATATAPVIDFIFDREDNDDVKDSSRSSNRTRRSRNSPCSSHPPHMSFHRLTSQNAPATAPASPPIEVEELDISIWATRPASPRLPNPLSHD